ncbi:MAG: TetR/AcrR family transcriptional regulator [Pseudomonadota bacterium]
MMTEGTSPASDARPSLSVAQKRKRAAILAAALDVFDRDGFEGARMIDIAEAAGVAKGTLYLYFETKEDLLEGLIEAVVMPVVRELEGASLLDGLDPSERLRAQLRVVSEQLSKGEMLKILKLMIANGAQRQRLRTFYFENVVRPNMTALSRTLSDGVESGHFREGMEQIDPTLLAAPFVMSAVWKMLFQDIDPIDDEILLQSVIRAADTLLLR